MTAPQRPTDGTPWSAILFDLDGTITDSAAGITSRLAETLAETGYPVPPQEDLLRYVGPPILDAFRDFAGMDEKESRRALTVYRRLAHGTLVDGITVYPGMAELLHDVHRAGIPFSLATSKPESQAMPILEHFGLIGYFREIAGATDDESRSAKADVVAEALRRLREKHVDLSRVVMVGDRKHDVEGSAMHGIPCIAVRWGYGNPAEWQGTIATADSVDDLRDLLL
ncbi:HAD hydrolase-like protein [Planctomonas psychrotolerans]|uniref:HAD hydrolase-like protein n=1 Tax=Planctomonas psychrotolerans TaxID=2528712 RepID=UPI0012387948|nr:HAD hydrolase-like protein [Planctomonas psychrotolerans]